MQAQSKMPFFPFSNRTLGPDVQSWVKITRDERKIRSRYESVKSSFILTLERIEKVIRENAFELKKKKKGF